MWTKGSSCITIELRDLLSHWRLVGLPDCPIMAISNLITPHTHSLQWSENPRVTREAMIEWKWNNDWVKVAILFYPSFKDKANVRHEMRRFLKIWEWREEKSRGEVLPPFNQKKKNTTEGRWPIAVRGTGRASGVCERERQTLQTR